MKKKNKKIESNDSGCFTAPPPWHNKTREQAWRIGHKAGYDNGYESAKLEMKAQITGLTNAERDARIKLINSAGQSIDAIARALSAGLNY